MDEETAQMSDTFCKNPLSEDRPSPLGLLESHQPVGMGSKTIFFNSMTKKIEKRRKFKSLFYILNAN